MNKTLLQSLIESNHPVLQEVAKAWNAVTTANFEIIADDNYQPAIPDVRSDVMSDNRGSLAEPLLLNGEAIGWIRIADCVEAHLAARLKADAQIVSTLLQQEYEIDKMTSELIDQQDQLMALHHLAQATRVQSDFQQTLTALAGVAARLLKTEGAFMQLEVANQEPHFASFPNESWAVSLWGGLLRNIDTTSARKQWLLQNGDPQLKQLGLPIRNLLMRKVQVRAGVSFVLGVVNKLSGDFQTPDVKLLGTIAEPAGANLENALLQRELLDQTRIQTEMELAKQVQMRLLLSRPPTVSGLDLAVQSRPAFQVGGDFYDFVVDANGLLTAVVGDVSGKGMPAALLMTMMRTVLRGKTLESGAAAPEQILDFANSHLYGDFSEVDMFATVFLSQYDGHTHTLYYANQGHSPVIYRPQDGQAYMLKADAPPLGILPESLAQRQTIDFKPGDLLVIATDGFSEAEQVNGEMFGYDRLFARIDELAALPAADLLAQLFQDIYDFAAGHPQSDDQTMLVIKRT